MKKFIFLFMLSLVPVVTGCRNKTEDLNTEKVLKNLDEYTVVTDTTALSAFPVDAGAPAGESEIIERSFENAPPLIPHNIEMFVPITADNNICMGCHIPENAEMIGATPIPETHFTSYRPVPGEKGGKIIVNDSVPGFYSENLGAELDNARFNCLQCHVPQTNATVEIKNYFEPAFRNTSGKVKSNLAKIMQEGVK